MHQIELKCVVYGYPNVSIFWSKAGKQADAERYIWNNKGLTKKVYGWQAGYMINGPL